jgi:hypothetical protein
MMKVDARDVCIEDFCGYTHPGHFHVAFWCDWIAAEGAVVFGGDWQEVPDMPAPNGVPTRAEINVWCLDHGFDIVLDEGANTSDDGGPGR